MSKENIKYSLKNLWERKGRSALTIFSILIGITTIFLFISFGLGLYSYVETTASSGSADKFLIQPGGFGATGSQNFFLNKADLNAVLKTKGVKDAEGLYFKSVKVQQDSTVKFVYIYGYNPKKNYIMEMSNAQIIQGRNLDANDNKVVLGYSYSQPNKIFPKPLKVGDKIDIDGTKFKVAGFMSSIGNPSDDSLVYMEMNYFEKLYPADSSFGIIIGVGEINQMQDIVDRVQKNVRKSRGEEEGKETFKVSSFQDLIDSYLIILNIIIGFVILVALISVFVSAINTANTMITSVLERVKEIGILKSIGAKNSEIFNVFLFESSFLGGVSGLLGLGFGYLLTSFLGRLLFNLGYGFLKPSYEPMLFIGCFIFSILVGAISGVIPAYNASKKKPVDSLRYE